jgi:hypothetical protein
MAYLPFGTYGRLTGDGFSCLTCERPWQGNEPFVSCIPEGTYPLKPSVWRPGKVNLETLEVCEVPNRSLIKIHTGNWPDDVEGCILVGAHFMGHHEYKLGISSSKATFDRIWPALQDADRITIEQATPSYWSPT